MAAGASFAAYQGTIAGPHESEAADVLLLASDGETAGGAGSAPAEQLTDTVSWADPSFQGVVASLYDGQAANAEREIAEEQARRPKVHVPTVGTLTSGYGPRWGDFHGGIDIANQNGTTISAATDGVVIDAGPAQGFGNWIRVISDDGIMTVYGHVDTVEVQKGQRVTAGQRIAGMGNQGFSTGTHLHFEVWIDGGTHRVDPLAWMRQQGIRVEEQVGPISPGQENLPAPGFESSGSLTDAVARAIPADPANLGSGAPGLADSLRSASQTTTNAADATELQNFASGRTTQPTNPTATAPMGPVASAPFGVPADESAASRTSTHPTTGVGAVAP